MIGPFWGAARKVVLGTALICPQVLVAQGFTGATFLSWSEADQRGYVSAQLVMASTIASRSKPEMVGCIANAFFEGTGMSDEKFAEIIETVGDYQDYHPSSVLVILIENACGEFG